MGITILLVAGLLYVLFKNVVNFLKFLFFIFVAIIFVIGVMIGKGCSSNNTNLQQNKIVQQVDTIEKNI